MSSNSPILVGIFAVLVAAFWYDATVASTGAHSTEARAGAAHVR
jgi:hypothetical protein